MRFAWPLLCQNLLKATLLSVQVIEMCIYIYLDVILVIHHLDIRKGLNVETAPVNFPGARRLQESFNGTPDSFLQEDNETLKCNGWVRELMPCEDSLFRLSLYI